MKRMIAVALLFGYVGLLEAVPIKVKNSLGVGAAGTTNGLKVANIGTFGTNYTYGTVTISGVEVKPKPVKIMVCGPYVNTITCGGVYINPGETKDIDAWGNVYVWGLYPATGGALWVKYAAQMKNLLDFPTDFAQTGESVPAPGVVLPG